ncbi:hypothetical protein, partial [Enterococcus faecium]
YFILKTYQSFSYLAARTSSFFYDYEFKSCIYNFFVFIFFSVISSEIRFFHSIGYYLIVNVAIKMVILPKK